MFTTTESYRSARFGPLRDGSMVWDLVDIEFNTIIFLVRFAVGDVKYQRYRSTFIGSLEALHALLAQEGGRLTQVEIITPPSANRSRRWKGEPLADAWEGRHPADPEATMRIYRTRSGAEYLDGFPQREIRNVTRVHKIYPFHTLDAATAAVSPNVSHGA